jgi:aminoglycoside phosphotransferase (APT) family kinase protein
MLRHFGLRDVRLESVPESYSSTVRRIVLPDGGRLILKIPYSRQKLLRELTALRALQPSLPVPLVVDAWVPEDDDHQNGGAMLLSHMPGAVIEDPVTPDLARKLGVLLGLLHTHRLPWYGEAFEPADPAAQNWWEVVHRRFEDWLRFCEGVVAESLLRRAVAAYESLCADLPEPDGPCWVHADFRPGNILVSDAHVTGLIDFESARGGSADYDFVKISLEVWDAVPGTQEAFLSGYDSVRPHPEIRRTLTLYQLHNAVGGLAWCVRRTDTRDPFYAENLAVVERILALHGRNRAH